MLLLATADLHIRTQEDTALLARILGAARAHGAAAVLIGGDLLDRPFLEAPVESTIRALLAEVGLPVFLAAGNHDPLAVTPFYQAPPENLRIFPPEMTCYTLQDGVRLYGYSAPREQGLDRPLIGFSAAGEGFNVLLAHGQPDGGKESFRPISNEELSQSGLDLAVVGHIHKGEMRLCGGCRLLVPGIPQGKGFDELGEKFVYLIDTQTGAINPLSVAEKIYREYPVDLSGCAEDGEALARMQAISIPENTIGRLILTGAPAMDPSTAAKLYTEQTGREVKDQTDPSLSADLLRNQNTLQGAFVRKAMAAIEAADAADRPRLEEAMRLGLQALKEARL